jgi:hypothetical protein
VENETGTVKKWKEESERVSKNIFTKVPDFLRDRNLDAPRDCGFGLKAGRWVVKRKKKKRERLNCDDDENE